MTAVQAQADGFFRELEAQRLELDAAGRVTIWEEPCVTKKIDTERRLNYALYAGFGTLLVGLMLMTLLHLGAAPAKPTSNTTTLSPRETHP